MSPTITEAFDLPRPEDIRAMGFVVKLREADPASAETKQLVDDYVITPVVGKELPRILADLKQVYERGEEYGRFVHGSFGSGKSHFMTMLSLLLETAAPAWTKFGPVIRANAQGNGPAPDHEAWLGQAKLLVVRIHMLTVRGKDTSLDRAIYEGFNQALKRRGKQPFEFLHLDAILEEVRREAAAYGDIVWKNLETAGIVGGKSDFETLVAGNQKMRERFARAWLQYKGRTPSDAGIDPRWSEGLNRMAEHAKGQGFGAIVLMLDEFLLWLAEKSGTEFVSEINNLNVIVDHSTGQRAAPIFVFVARQRNLQEFFPDLVDEAKIHEHLDHHAKRFEETKLQDVELRHIVKGRVLKPKDDAALRQIVGTLSERHQKVLPALMAGADMEYLRDVYPFHPALIEMLVDVTSLMQRERSALRLLYELLVLHYPDLPLGEFLPVGSAFAAIFPEAGVEASKKVDLMQDIHHQYYSRLAPTMRRMAEDPEFTTERRIALDQAVKTVLLAEVSPRLKQSGLTIERLVQLNSVDVEGETLRGQVRVMWTDLLTLSREVPDLQVAGQDKTATVRFVLGRVSLGEVLGRARSKVDNVAQRFRVFWPALKKALGIAGMKGFEDGSTEGDYKLTWRRTERRGRLKLGNIREMSSEDFEAPAGTFKILVDYPWDDPGHGVEADRQRAANARKKLGNRFTTCWLPRHFTSSELSLLTELAAVRHLLSEGQEELLETLAPQDRTKIIDQAAIRAKTLEGQVDELLVEVYIRHAELITLMSDVDTRRPHQTLAENLEHMAALLMDRRYPQHPNFLADPRKTDLELLCDWMVEAGNTSTSVMYDEAKGKVLKSLGQPLELVNLGQTKAALRLDSRYIKDVLAQTDKDSLMWPAVAEYLRDTYGLQQQIIDLFLCFLCKRDHRALEENTDQPVGVSIGMSPGVRVRLQRGKVTSTAEWGRLGDLANDLFGMPRPPARSLQAQDRFAAEMEQRGVAQRDILQAVHNRLVDLGVEQGARLSQIETAISRLAPFVRKTTDSHKVLTEFIAAWPDDPADPLRRVVSQVDVVRDALADVSDDAWKHLQGGVEHLGVGVEVSDHLAALHQRLAATDVEQPLTRAWAQSWTKEAQALIRRLIQQVPTPPALAPPGRTTLEAILVDGTAGKAGSGRSGATDGPEGGPRSDEGASGNGSGEVAPVQKPPKVLLRRWLNAADPDAVTAFLGLARKALQQHRGGDIDLALVVVEEVAE